MTLSWVEGEKMQIDAEEELRTYRRRKKADDSVDEDKEIEE